MGPLRVLSGSTADHTRGSFSSWCVPTTILCFGETFEEVDA